MYVSQLSLNASDCLVMDQSLALLDFLHQQRLVVNRRLRAFATTAPLAEQEARAVLQSVPCVGPDTINVLLSELGDIRRFRAQNDVVQYAGLAPGIRESAGRAKQLGITKEGSPLLRWTLIQLAWRLVNRTRRWGSLYEKLKQRCGSKKAIVAVARRALCVLVSLLKSGQRYHLATEILVSA
jgi:transposase